MKESAVNEEKPKQPRCDICTKPMKYNGRCWQCRWLLNDDDEYDDDEQTFGPW